VARIQKLQGLKAWLYWQTDGFNEPLFVIQIVKEKYDLFEPSQQIAVLDHELSHLYFSDVTGEPCINPNHDIEENSIIVKRHGAWHGGLESFYKSLQIGAENQSLREEILNRVRE
jgi:predicted metallopeptidase